MAMTLPAQTFTALASFNGKDGISPLGGLIQGVNGDGYGTSRPVPSPCWRCRACRGGWSMSSLPHGWLPVSAALWLLKVLRSLEHVTPGGERAPSPAAREPGSSRLPEKWRRLLYRRRCRLVHLLQTAVMREEDVRWQFRL